MIKIIDYGLGNIGAFLNVYKRLNIACAVAQSAPDLDGVSKLILPGVGSFDHAMQQLDASGMRPKIADLVFEQNVPILGICVGMQILASLSDEGTCSGLDWISGRVCKMRDLTVNPDFCLPHMGWNDVHIKEIHPLFAGLEQGARFYFLHSFYFKCDKPENILAEAEYGQKFTCSVHHKNIHGVQFHPEKSHHYGARLLKNFAEL